ncbi:MAG: hypothetical protein E7640_00590 [Ruminococcaceae bacterium]|nr:hypothetical protein [Oscillospiraceae bacterium]
MVKFKINGIECTAEEGEFLLSAAKKNGIDIPNLCNHPSVGVYGSCGLCLVEASHTPKLLRACATAVTDGMEIKTETPRVKRARKIALELLMSDHSGDCIGPCSLNCPAGTDCQGYVKKIALGDMHGAVEIIKDKLPLPASIGRVCPHPCERACRRANVEAPISIATLKYFAADRDLSENTYKPTKCAPTGKRVSIIGAGPAGLTAAYFLSLSGHSVTVYDAMPKAGGMLRYGIPAYRLPKNILDAEIALIAELGVEFKLNTKIGRDISFEMVRSAADATVIAVGAWRSMSMRIPGEELDGVRGGIDFLREVSLYNSGEGEKPEIGDNVLICGGGNTAMDACRSAVRLGAENVYVAYRRTRAEMPADPEEIEQAIEEGVKFRFLQNPIEILGEDGKVTGAKLQVMELGEPDASGRRSPVAVEGKFEHLDLDTVIEAIGQTLDFSGDFGVEYNKRGYICADEASFATAAEGVFAIGDATNRGASIAIEAIGEANRAARVIDSYLAGETVPYKKPFVSEQKASDIDFSGYEKKPREQVVFRPADERKKDFCAITDGLTESQAIAEAKRCLECGCHDYSDCRLIREARKEDLDPARLAGEKNRHKKEQRLVCIERDNGKCILCSLCVRTCSENAKRGLLGLVGRGFDTVIKPEFIGTNAIADCKSCRLCVDICPTGALKFID